MIYVAFAVTHLSRTYRSGLVDVEPKQTVDARSFQVTGDRAFSTLPPSVSGQVLYGTQGDLVDAQRGVISFSDLLKRPYEQYKYLLTATESARVVLDHVLLGLDVVFTGSANDINLLEFRKLRAAEGWKTVLGTEDVPLMLISDGAAGQSPQRVLAFEPANSDWPLPMSYPIFMTNAVLHLAGR